MHSYKGYAFDDDTTTTADGRYRARVILVTVENGRAPAQRSIDLETFAKEDDTRQRAIAAAREWIDEEGGTTTTWHCLPAYPLCSELEHPRSRKALVGAGSHVGDVTSHYDEVVLAPIPTNHEVVQDRLVLEPVSLDQGDRLPLVRCHLRHDLFDTKI